MESLKLWARHGEAGRQAIALGERVPMATAREECTEAGRLCAIDSGRLQTWAEACPAPRREPDSGLEVLLPAHLAGRFAGLDARRNTGYGLRAARVLGALGYRVEGREPAQGLAVRGTADDQRCSGDGGRQRWGTRAQPVALSQGSPGPGAGPRVAVNVRERASRRAGNHVVEEAEAAIRALRVAAPLGQWAPPQVAGSRGQAARLGRGRQGHRRDPPRVEGPVAPGPSEGRGVVKHDAGPSARGDQRATLRPLLASAGLRSPGAMAALQGHDVARCRPWWARAAV